MLIEPCACMPSGGLATGIDVGVESRCEVVPGFADYSSSSSNALSFYPFKLRNSGFRNIIRVLVQSLPSLLSTPI